MILRCSGCGRCPYPQIGNPIVSWGCEDGVETETETEKLEREILASIARWGRKVLMERLGNGPKCYTESQFYYDQARWRLKRLREAIKEQKPV